MGEVSAITISCMTFKDERKTNTVEIEGERNSQQSLYMDCAADLHLCVVFQGLLDGCYQHFYAA